MPDVEEHIRRAIQEGEFEELPGKGKPLRIDENPLEGSEWRLAHHLLQSSGFTLPWIEMRQEIEQEIGAARTALRRAWEWRDCALAESQPRHTVNVDWEQAVETFHQEVEHINQRIRDYNLQVPSVRFQRLALSSQREVQTVLGGGVIG